MGRRRRGRRRIVRRKKVIPKVFTCPNCGQRTVKVSTFKNKNMVLVKCGFCGLAKEFEYTAILAPVDYYSRFVDAFYT
ncbi:MAG: hypothetical protein DRJ49_03520 [Thermoprotei archaeon]|nr:MAG: hypothetical protein DRJ49_03520 [Thermoprotei archaeon]